MNSFRYPFLIACIIGIVFLCTSFELPSNRNAGFYLPDSVSEMRIQYKENDGLIILPFVINDSIQVDLVLDTGTSNIILFGKKFKNLIDQTARKIHFSGHGDGAAREGFAMTGVRLKLDIISGDNIPVVVIPKRVFHGYSAADGVIGLDILQKFEVEIDPSKRIICFRPAATAELGREYSRASLKIDGHLPVLSAMLTTKDGNRVETNLAIDTGSMLGLLMVTDNLSDLNPFDMKVIATGLNGDVYSYKYWLKRLNCEGLTLTDVPIAVTFKKSKSYASIGMGLLKEYRIVLNYPKGYVGFKKSS
jgi:hypothetical protein